MLGQAYGKLNGVSGQFLCSVRGRKTTENSGFGTYPVTLDFSALGVSGFRAQVFSRSGALKYEGLLTNEPVMHTEYNGYKLQRVNPFWRTPQGGIAVVLEFGGSTGFELPGQQIYPAPSAEPSFLPFGTKLILHALNPTGVVEHVSRVDITTGGGMLPGEEQENSDGLSTFLLTDVRPGYFGRAHLALQDAIFSASGGKVTVRDPSPNDIVEPGTWHTGLPTESAGVFVEFNHASRASIDVQPLELPDNNTNSSLAVSVTGTLAGGYSPGQPGQYLGFVRVRRAINTLLLEGLLPPLGNDEQTIRAAVYNSGTLVGMTPVLAGDGRLSPITLSGNPQITTAAAMANSSQTTPGISIAFATNTTFVITNGLETFSFTGNEVRILSVGRIMLDSPLGEVWFESVDGVALLTTALPEFTIVSEQEQAREIPRLTIERSAQTVRLSWLDPNRVYALQSSSDLTLPFAHSPLEVSNTNGMASATTTFTGTNSFQFFRLFHVRGYWD
jgi:hypothetical protein